MDDVIARRRTFDRRVALLLRLAFGAIAVAFSSARMASAARTPWTASHITGSPEPPLPYQTRQAFPKLRFKNPLDIAFADGVDRVFIAEQFGKVYSFRNAEDCDKADLFADLPAECTTVGITPFASAVGAVYGLAFHPHFAQHRFVYICYVLNFQAPPGHAPLTPKETQGTRVSRFDVTDADPPHIDPKSEKILLTWYAGGHNGGCVKFGPDGYLYVSSGDGGDPDPPDPFNTGQDISDLLSSVLRIDVDHADADKAYSIPADNPFVHTPGARPEVYAYGLRNPWRMNFDSKTGNLWVGDVGWELYESVQCIKAGGNYGWSIMEGPNPVHPDGKRGPTPITPPALWLDHTEAASLTGGTVYHGKKLPDLDGYYIFGDWQTARLWAAKCNGDTLEPHRTIAQTDQRIVAFGEAPDGELLIVDHQGGGLWRIVPNEQPNTAATFPRKLSETGLFNSTKDQTPAPGVIPFSINAAQWLDGTTARRWIAVPGSANVTWGKGVWNDDKPAWPKESVLVRTLSISFESLGPNQQKPVETQLLHFNGKQWNAYTYAWNADHTDAELISAEGDDRSITVPDWTDMTLNMPKHNGVKQQPWHFQSRAQCMTCHNVWDDYALAFNKPQLDRTDTIEGIKGNEAETFHKLGLLLDPLKQPDDTSQRTALTDPYDASGDLNERARSYLHVNCSACHRFGGGGSALFDVRKELPPDKLHLIDARPNLGAFGLDDARIVCPGHPERSVLLYRMAKLGRGRMPHIGSSVVDHRGVQLLMQWIRSLGPDRHANDDAAAAKQFEDPATLDRLLTSATGAMSIICALHSNKLDPDAYNLMSHKGIACTDESIHDLFRAYDPAEEGRVRLGTNINVKKLLALRGDENRGRQIFFTQGGTGLCARCHKIDNQGIDFGPDLSHIATKYNRADLLDNIIHPSKTIAPGYATYVVRTKSGDTFSGLLIKRTDQELILKDPQLKETHIPAVDVEKSAAQTISAMPDGLLADLDQQQAADLLAFIAGRK
jgi:putative heme-binding domain-containing protein